MQSNRSESGEQNSAEDPTLTQHTQWELYFGVALICFHDLNTVQQWDCNTYVLGVHVLLHFHPKVIQSECFEIILNVNQSTVTIKSFASKAYS